VEQHGKQEANKAAQHKSGKPDNQNRNQHQNNKQRHNKSQAKQPVTAMAAAFANMKK
jgi:hypothetical protein